MHHPLIDQKDLRKMPEEKIQEKLSDLKKRKNLVMRTNANIDMLQQIESLVNVYSLELADRTAKRLAKQKDKGSDMDDLINIE
jgi:hypothetical protein|tara:strand:+ start:420 stop:668 length:249 start_codon:yes stop_codon:yes gene_type:complete